MGDHYTPRKYLRGFCAPGTPGLIWVYDRLTKRSFASGLANVGQENDFYSKEDEVALANTVEGPANPVLDKMRQGEAIDDDERSKLAVYIATFIYRVPHRRQLAVAGAPAQFANTVENVKAQVALAGGVFGWSKQEIEKKLQEVDAVYEKYADDPSRLIPELIRSPWPTEKICDVVATMTWRLLTTSGPSYFLTSDNPVFFFTDRGLNRPDSEMTWPISTGLVLHGSWRKGRQCERIAVRQLYVREMNRRTASKSTRFLFYHQPEDWVAILGDAPPTTHRLNEIRW